VKDAYRTNRTIREVAELKSGLPQDELNRLLDPRSQT
jgi:hypothetical protein